jgi:endogenous inhibitor of DNA gyrase (YacG/DUF329 family)
MGSHAVRCPDCEWGVAVEGVPHPILKIQELVPREDCPHCGTRIESADPEEVFPK